MSENTIRRRIFLAAATFFAILWAGLFVTTIYAPLGMVLVGVAPVVSVAILAGFDTDSLRAAAAAAR